MENLKDIVYFRDSFNLSILYTTVTNKKNNTFLIMQEPYMEVINPFIRDNQQRMVMFLDELSVSLCIIYISRNENALLNQI